MNEELKVIITAQVQKFKSGVDDAKKKINDFKTQVKKASQDVNKKISAMGEGIKSAAKTIGVALAGAVAALMGLSAATEEYRQNQALLATAFEMAGGSADGAKKTYNDLYRVLGDGGQATEAAQHLAKLTTEEKALSEWTTVCQGVYATFGASLPIESLTEAANETAKTGSLTGSLADALNWAGVSEEAFTEQLNACNTEAEREALIRETLNGLYSDAAAKYEENNAGILAQREAQAKLQSNLALLGEAMAPVNAAFTSFASDCLAIITPYIQDLVDVLLPGLKTLLNDITTALENALVWMREHETLLKGLAIAIGIITTAILLYNVVAGIKSAMAALEVASVWGLVAAYAAQAVAVLAALAPYILIVAAIAAVIAIIVLCVKHWDKIKAKIVEVWGIIVAWITEKAEAIKEKVSGMVESVKQWFSDMGTKMSDAIAAAKEAVVNKFNDIKEGIRNKIASAKLLVITTFNSIKTSITDKITAAKESVLSIFESIKTGIKDKIEAAKTTVSDVIDKIKGFFNFEWSLPKLKMPSISITGKFSLSPLEVPKFSINWNALGGVFDKPAIFGYGNSLQGIGENGAEAVVPLEKNTKWLDVIANKLAAKQGSSAPIVLEVDGKVFGQIAETSLNNLTRQRGYCGINFV